MQAAVPSGSAAGGRSRFLVGAAAMEAACPSRNTDGSSAGIRFLGGLELQPQQWQPELEPRLELRQQTGVVCEASFLSVNTFPFDFESLHAAWLNCRKGKAGKAARWSFEAVLERQLLALAGELEDRSYQPSPSVCFITEQPKRREIFAAAFRDRVVHHLVVGLLEPYWEPRFIHDSYACRRGKGTQAAVDRVQMFMRQVSANGSKRAFVLHLDVRSFFVRIHKQTLFDILDDGLRRQGVPWEDDLRWLLERIVFRDPAADALRIGGGFAAVPEHKSLFHANNLRGLPIGNYTSQFFANVYLDRLDRFVKHELKARHYLRYVDDLILLHEDRAQLERWEAAIDAFLREELKLELNHNRRRLAPVSSGVDALGYVVHLHHRHLRRRTVRRFRAVLGEAERAFVREREGGWLLRGRGGDFERLMARCMSYRGLLGKADSHRLMQRTQAGHAWAGLLWQVGKREHVLRRFHLMRPQARLARQWQAFRRLWPGARLLLRVGGYWEAYGPDAAWLRELLRLGAGRGRAGLPQAAGFAARDTLRLRRVLAQTRCPVVLLEQTGRRAGGLQERTVRAAWLPEDAEFTPSAWLVADTAHRPGRPCVLEDGSFSTRRRKR